MSQFPMYFHTFDVTHISSCSRTMLTWKKCFGPQEQIYLLAARHPRSKLLILINSNEHKGCKFVQLFDYVKKQTTNASGTKSAEKQLHICSTFASSKVCDPNNEAIVPSFWNTLRTLKSLRYASSGFTIGKSQPMAHRDWEFGHFFSYLTFSKAATISAHSWPKKKGKFSYPMHKTAKSKGIESTLQYLHHTSAMFHWCNSIAM